MTFLTPFQFLTRRAFTLIELLVSISVLALMMVLFLAIFTGASQSFGLTRSTVESFESARTFSLQLNRELGSAMVRDWSGYPAAANRQMRFRVQQNVLGYDTLISFLSPDISVSAQDEINFVNHHQYFYVAREAAIYRAEFRTPMAVVPNLIDSTANNVDSSNRNFNLQRLTRLTPAYLSPTGWTNNVLIRETRDLVYNEAAGINLPLLRNVFFFEVLCHTENGDVFTTWTGPLETQLPRFVEIRFGVADQNLARRLRVRLDQGQDLTQDDLDQLRYFSLNIPMRNFAVQTNDIWAP